MNLSREQMIAWLTLEGVTLHIAPIAGSSPPRTAWAARHDDCEIQRYNDKPDTWERYAAYPYCKDRKPVDYMELPLKLLRDLVKEVMDYKDRHEP